MGLFLWEVHSSNHTSKSSVVFAEVWNAGVNLQSVFSSLSRRGEKKTFRKKEFRCTTTDPCATVKHRPNLRHTIQTKNYGISLSHFIKAILLRSVCLLSPSRIWKDTKLIKQQKNLEDKGHFANRFKQPL